MGFLVFATVIVSALHGNMSTGSQFLKKGNLDDADDDQQFLLNKNNVVRKFIHYET